MRTGVKAKRTLTSPRVFPTIVPLLKMDTLGHDFVPPGIHAGGLTDYDYPIEKIQEALEHLPLKFGHEE